MKSKWLLIPVVAILLIVAITLGICTAFRVCDPKSSEQTEPTDLTGASFDIDLEPDYGFEHTTGEAVVDFEEGNEVFLDGSLVAYLERLEQGVPAVDEDGNYYLDADGGIVYDTSIEKHVEGVLDNLITLINHFAREEYSADASHQIQRFYVMYYDCFQDIAYEELIANMARCFPRAGADPEVLPVTVLEVFGFMSGDDFAFVFTPLSITTVRVEFCNVLPSEVALTEEEEGLCLYHALKNAEDDGYERHLEGWLHNVIRAARDASLDEEQIHVAQLIYAGSLADAEYRSGWADALVRCLTVESWTYDDLKLAVEEEFGVSLDSNVPVQAYFETRNMEVKVKYEE